MSGESTFEPTAPESPEDAPRRPEGPSRPGLAARILAVLLPGAICLGGAAFAGLMVATRPAAEHAERASPGLPVRVQRLEPSTEPIAIHAQGLLVAARQVVMQPELSGRVIWMNEDLVPGGRLAAGAPLLRIDPRNYRSALEAQRAQLESGRLQIRQEESRRRIAEREWALLGREAAVGSPEGRELALREPQLRSARAALRAAESGLRRARTDLSRTTLRAPFDSFVQSEGVDLGQLVGPQSQVATLVGTEHFWVRVSVPVEQLRWVRLPDGDGPGSAATIVQRVGERDRIERRGRVIRLLGDLDPVGRMARLLVEVDDPLGLQRDDGGLPMLLGAFVDVEIEAGQLEGVYRIPREALHPGDRVYLFQDGRLEIRAVEIAWRDPESLLVRGLRPGEELVRSPVATPIEGTRLHRAGDEDGGVER